MQQTYVTRGMKEQVNSMNKNAENRRDEEKRSENFVNRFLFCFSFDRPSIGGRVSVQRNCIPTDSFEFNYMRDLIGQRTSACIKRINGMDCYKLCSSDACN